MAKANVLIAQYNVVTAEYQNADLVKPFKRAYSRQLPDTNITRHYYHYAESFTGSFKDKMEHFDKAMQLIAPIAIFYL